MKAITLARVSDKKQDSNEAQLFRTSIELCNCGCATNLNRATTGMARKRDEHREPVIRAFVALPGETLVEVVERRLPGSGLCVINNH
ncbi:MAG: hypothetical protein Q7R69_01770 [bacterium]|nr:hypothetical protein [bacterium]